MMSKVVFDLFLIYAQIYFFPKRNMIMYLQFILLFIFFYSVLPICLILSVLFCFRNVCTFPSPIECMFHYYVDAVSIFNCWQCLTVMVDIFLLVCYSSIIHVLDLQCHAIACVICLRWKHLYFGYDYFFKLIYL